MSVTQENLQRCLGLLKGRRWRKKARPGCKALFTHTPVSWGLRQRYTIASGGFPTTPQSQNIKLAMAMVRTDTPSYKRGKNENKRMDGNKEDRNLVRMDMEVLTTAHQIHLTTFLFTIPGNYSSASCSHPSSAKGADYSAAS